MYNKTAGCRGCRVIRRSYGSGVRADTRRVDRVAVVALKGRGAGGLVGGWEGWLGGVCVVVTMLDHGVLAACSSVENKAGIVRRSDDSARVAGLFDAAAHQRKKREDEGYAAKHYAHGQTGADMTAAVLIRICPAAAPVTGCVDILVGLESGVPIVNLVFVGDAGFAFYCSSDDVQKSQGQQTLPSGSHFDRQNSYKTRLSHTSNRSIYVGLRVLSNSKVNSPCARPVIVSSSVGRSAHSSQE